MNPDKDGGLVGGTDFSVSSATRMLSRVSLGGPGRTAGGAAVADPTGGGGGGVRDDPGTTEASSPCPEPADSELSARPLTSAPVARREELEKRREREREREVR